MALVAVVKETLYSASIGRAIRAALALDNRTDNLRLVFKGRAKAELDLLLQGTGFLIYKK